MTILLDLQLDILAIGEDYKSSVVEDVIKFINNIANLRNNPPERPAV